MAEPDDPTRRTMRPTEWVPPTPADCAVTFGQVALEGGVLCVECRACNARTALTKAECPEIRVGNGAFVRWMLRMGHEDIRGLGKQAYRADILDRSVR